MKTSSPTEHILDLWDVKNRKPEAITDLLNALRLMVSDYINEVLN